MSADAPPGTFEEQVLLAVVRTGEEAYGMRIRREIDRVTGREVAIGAVQTTLERLEAKGLVVSGHRSVAGRSRRVFALTGNGVAALTESRDMRARLWRGVDLDHLPMTGNPGFAG